MIKAALVLLLNVSPLSSHPLSIEMFFEPDEVNKVLQGEIYTFSRFASKVRNTDGSKEVTKLPVTEYLARELQGYEIVTVEKTFFSYDLKTKSKLALYNYLQRYSALAGILYYSRTDQKVQRLVLESYRVDSADLKQKEKDPVHTQIEDYHKDHVYLRDNRFGKIIFSSEVFHKDDHFVTRWTNVKPLSMFRMPVSDRGQYQLISFYIYDRDRKGYFYYAVHAAKVRSGLIRTFGRLSPESFANRIRAMTVHVAAFFEMDWSRRRKVF